MWATHGPGRWWTGIYAVIGDDLSGLTSDRNEDRLILRRKTRRSLLTYANLGLSDQHIYYISQGLFLACPIQFG